MLSLLLLRHAKSAWGDPTLDDHERALAPRGIKAAPEVGRFIARNKLEPDLVLCSDAVRTRATLALVLHELRRPVPDIIYDRALYLATPAAMLDVLTHSGGTRARVMIIGHNPGLHALALELVGSSARRDLGQLAAKFPTAALAVLTFEAARWADIRPGSGRLEHFVTPKDLRD